MIKIIFKGRLVEGQEKAQVIKNLSSLTKKPPEVVTKKLFSGKAVVVKQVKDAAQAEKYRQAFIKAGALVEVVDDAAKSTPQKERPRVDTPGRVDSSSKKTTPGKDTAPIKATTRKFPLLIKIASGVAVTVAVAFGGYYYWFISSVLDMQAPPDVPVIEQALAEKELMAVAHINLAKSIELQNKLLGIEAGEELIDPGAEGAIADLRKAGIDIQNSVTHVLAAFYVKEPQPNDQQTKNPGAAMTGIESWSNLVLLGDFPVEKVRDYIIKHYETEKVTLGNFKLLQFRRQDVESCQYSTPRVIEISKHRLVISEPKHAAQLLDRIKNKSAAAIDMAQWQQYRNQHLFSAAVIAPQNSKHAARGIIGMMIAQLQQQVAPVESIYAGGSVETIPPGLILHASLNTAQQAWIDTTHDKWQTGLNNFKQKMDKETASVAKMLENLKVSSAPGGLGIELRLDSELGKNGRQLFEDLLASAFSVRSTSNAGGQPQAEQLDNSPLPFNTNYSLTKLPNYRDLEFMGRKHSWSEGPFMIDVESVALDANDNIEISLKSEARGLENLGDLRNNLHLHITEAVNAESQSILKQQKCGRNRSDKATPFGLVMRTSNPTTNDSRKELIGSDGKIHYTQTSASKKLHLAEDARLDDLAAIKGFIELDQPTQLEIRILESPLAGQRVSFQGMQMNIKSAAEGKLSFNVSGDKTKLLNVRALNKDRKPLNRGSSSSMGAIIGSSTSYSQNYKGDIAFVEVVLVKKNVQKRFPFQIDQLFQAADKDSVREYEPVQTFKRSQYDKRFAKLTLPVIKGKAGWLGEPMAGYNQGPLALALYKPQVSRAFGATGSVKVNLPLVPGLANNLSGVEIAIDMVSTAAGNNHTVGFSNYFDVSRPIKYYTNGKPVYEEGKEFLEGQNNINIRYKDDTSDIKSFEGKIRLRLPTKLEKLDVGKPGLGTQVGNDEIAVRLIAMRPGLMRFQITGDRSKLVSFYVFNKDDKLISNRQPTFHNDKNGWTVEASYSGTPVRLELIYAPTQDVVSYPFVLNLTKSK